MTEPFDAAFRGDRAALSRWLASHAGEVNATFHAERQTTLLYTAARFGREECVTLLLEKGADPAVANRSDDASTPLHGAAYGGHAAIVTALRRAGGDVDATNKFKETPLKNANAPADGVTKAAKAATVAALKAKIEPVVPTEAATAQPLKKKARTEAKAASPSTPAPPPPPAAAPAAKAKKGPQAPAEVAALTGLEPDFDTGFELMTPNCHTVDRVPDMFGDMFATVPKCKLAFPTLGQIYSKNQILKHYAPHMPAGAAPGSLPPEAYPPNVPVIVDSCPSGSPSYWELGILYKREGGEWAVYQQTATNGGYGCSSLSATARILGRAVAKTALADWKKKLATAKKGL